MAAVRDDNFYGFAIGVEMSAQEQFPDRRTLHRLGGIIDQVNEHTPQEFSIRANCENSLTSDSSAVTSRSIRPAHSPTRRTNSGGSGEADLPRLDRLRSR